MSKESDKYRDQDFDKLKFQPKDDEMWIMIPTNEEAQKKAVDRIVKRIRSMKAILNPNIDPIIKN